MPKTAQTIKKMSESKKRFWAEKEDKSLTAEHKKHISEGAKRGWEKRKNKWSINGKTDWDLCRRLERGYKDRDIMVRFVNIFDKLPSTLQMFIIQELQDIKDGKL